MAEWVVLGYADAHHDDRTAFFRSEPYNPLVKSFWVATNGLQQPNKGA